MSEREREREKEVEYEQGREGVSERVGRDIERG